MRLLVISDIHGQMDMVRRLFASPPKADLVIISGDITNFGGYQAAAQVIEPIAAKGVPILAVAGNCDTEGVDEYLIAKNFGLDGHCARHENYTFIGVSGSLPCPGHTPSEHGEFFFDNKLSGASHLSGSGLLTSQTDHLIVVTHQPALDTKVDCVSGIHRGSESIRRFIETHKPILAISGHIHEAFGTDTLGPTTLVNPGPLKQGRYAIVEIEGMQVRTHLQSVG